MLDKDFKVDHLTGDALKAAEIIRKAVSKVLPNASGGGCPAFWSPEQWKERDEKYGDDALLVCMHDGGDLASFINYDHMQYDRIDMLSEHLQEGGFYIEDCTGWYSAVYKVK